MSRNLYHKGLYTTPFRTIIFQIKTEKESLYNILEIKPSASQEEVKKAFYALAKKYHPDFNPDENAGDSFKRVQKAYEVLSNPLTRQTYDIEHRFNEDLSNDIKDKVYSQKLGRKNYYVSRDIKDFYYNQWTDYKKPNWYHPYNGYDVRSQYLYRKKQDERMWSLPPYLDIFLEKAEENRIFIYLLLFFLGDMIRIYLNYHKVKRQQLELELLEQSFSLDVLTDDDSEVIDFSDDGNDQNLSMTCSQ